MWGWFSLKSTCLWLQVENYTDCLVLFSFCIRSSEFIYIYNSFNWSFSKASLLQERIEKLTFEEMQNPKSPLFSNDLAKLIKASKRVGPASGDTCLHTMLKSTSDQIIEFHHQVSH